LRDRGEIGSFARNIRRIASRFWKCYVGRRGYREGAYGFLIALCAALYPVLSYLKARLEPSQPAKEPLIPATGETHSPPLPDNRRCEPPHAVGRCRSDKPLAE